MDAVVNHKFIQGCIIANQQMSLVQLYVFKTGINQLEQAQPDNCDKLFRAESDEAAVSTELCPTRTTYYFLRDSHQTAPQTLNQSQQ